MLNASPATPASFMAKNWPRIATHATRRMTIKCISSSWAKSANPVIAKKIGRRNHLTTRDRVFRYWDCIRQSTARSVTRRSFILITPSDCYSCHKKDDDKVHKRRLGKKCESCHNARPGKYGTLITILAPNSSWMADTRRSIATLAIKRRWIIASSRRRRATVAMITMTCIGANSVRYAIVATPPPSGKLSARESARSAVDRLWNGNFADIPCLVRIYAQLTPESCRALRKRDRNKASLR